VAFAMAFVSGAGAAEDCAKRKDGRVLTCA
jgi:hypothetical protein